MENKSKRASSKNFPRLSRWSKAHSPKNQISVIVFWEKAGILTSLTTGRFPEMQKLFLRPAGCPAPARAI